MTAALVSNTCWLSHGVIGQHKLNLGVVLIGRPSLRKSSAITFAQRFANDLVLNYGPTDTGAARHGIMSGMQTRWQDDSKDDSDGKQSGIAGTIGELSQASYDSIIARVLEVRTRPSSVYFTAKELGRLLTSQTRELLDFFADGIDGEAIFYQTKNGNIRIPAPLINLLGATTPGSLPGILPRDSHNHGFLSRLIFVYAGQGEKAVPILPKISKEELEIQGILRERIERVSSEAAGEITFDSEAMKEYIRLYEYSIATTEFKLNAYAGRRATHLSKLAGIICLLRGEAPYIVNREDIAMSHTILMLTERDMDAAYMGIDKTPEGRAYGVIREVLESFDASHEEAGVLLLHLSRAGFSEEDSNYILERLLKSKRLAATHAGKITLPGSISGQKALLYINSLLKRKATQVAP